MSFRRVKVNSSTYLDLDIFRYNKESTNLTEGINNIIKFKVEY